MGQFPIAKRYPYFIAGMLVFLGLYLASLHSYLLFHSLAEIFSIVVACGIFMVAWNSRRFLDNHYLLFLGIAYLFVGGIDLIHTLAYKGMGIFQGYGTNPATQLWIAARYTESFSLLIAPFFIRRKLKINPLFLGYLLAFALILLSIFYWNLFPVCFIEGVGLTPFKKISEYVISLIFLASIPLLLKHRSEFDRDVLKWVVCSIVFAVASELAFTFYTNAYGFSNLLGHFLKIVSFYLIYKALIEMGLTRPYDLLFRNLKESERKLREEKNKLQNYLDIAGVILVAIDANQNVSLINKKGCEILGFGEKEIIGKNWFDAFIPEGIREEVKAKFRKLTEGEVSPVEYFENPVLTRTGEERTIAWYNAILRNGQANGISTLSSGEDITERKKMEEELRRSRDALEKRVEERTADLAKANEELRIEINERKLTEKALQESEEHLRHLSSQLLTAQEDERKRISRELHDSIGSSLSALKFGLENALTLLNQGMGSVKSLEPLVSMAQRTIEESRRISKDLWPSILNDLGILAAIHWFCREFQAIYPQIQIKKEIRIREEEVPDPLKIVLYRIIQEALNNVAKHSRAESVFLSLTKTERGIELTVQDNGYGFDLENSKKGLGLASMKERAKLSGGSFFIDSVQGRETTLKASWSL